MLFRKDRFRILAMVLLGVLPVAFSPAMAAPPTGSISGVVLTHDTHAPAAGVKVHVADPSTGRVYESAATGSDGSFDVEGLPSSNYELGLEQDGKLYLVNTPVSVAPGRNETIQVALGTPGDIAPAQAASVWSNPLTAALIVAGGAVVVGLVVDQAVTDDTPTSPSQM